MSRRLTSNSGGRDYGMTLNLKLWGSGGVTVFSASALPPTYFLDIRGGSPKHTYLDYDDDFCVDMRFDL